MRRQQQEPAAAAAQVPRKAFAWVCGLGHSSPTGLPQFNGTVTAMYLVMGPSGLVDLFTLPTVQVTLAYGDIKAAVDKKIQQAIREQLGDSSVECVVV